MHFLPQETIEARFNLKGDEGVVIEAVGTISRGMTGMGFIYSNKECISLGIGCLVSDFQRTGETPYALLDRFKRHPSVAPLIEGSEVKEYAAHLIPEGGFKSIPQLYGDGWVVVGDAAALLGRGYLAFTCDQGPEMDRYQGIVAITGRDLAEMTGAYFETSEQIAAWVRLAAAPTPRLCRTRPCAAKFSATIR